MVKKFRYKLGYTLSELLISMMIISILALISVPIYYRMAKILPEEAKLTTAAQKLFFLLSDSRKNGFVQNNVVCIKYENRTFSSFIDNDFDGNPDENKIISFFSLNTEDTKDIKVKFNNQEISSIKDFYTVDGIFVKSTGSGNFDLSYSNSSFE
ncbi:MAG TPA: prepilin-type N-terminal cleavage/methylation domain-containing protein, partial [Fervidobacterium nodosum]|nr:prepilin-type N-terminal cleavage/methylation domain-containing protein [Fervidobacterium nodosum]